MNCLLEFSKMTFTNHFIFTFLTGIIFWSLFDEITIHGNVKTTFHYVLFMFYINFFTVFFMLSTCYSTRCFLRFFLGKKLSRIYCNFVFITFLNRLWHSLIFQDVLSLFWTFFTCYSTRCFFSFFLLNTRFSHSLQLRAFLHGLPHSKHVTAQDVCWIYSRINVSCILCML